MIDPTTEPGAPTARPAIPLGEPTTYLGPARVVGAERGAVVVTLDEADGETVRVTPAFPFPYTATEGDALLVLGQGDRHFAVGVLAGARPPVLDFHGDASIRAVNGRLTLASDRAVELRAPRVTVRTGVLRTIAGRVVEKADGMRRWVKGLLAVRAGESRRLVDGNDTTRCQNSTTLAKDTVKIDGDQLHLGH